MITHIWLNLLVFKRLYIETRVVTVPILTKACKIIVMILALNNFGEISPYPTVDNVVIVKYKRFIYLSKFPLSSSNPLNSLASHVSERQENKIVKTIKLNQRQHKIL